MICGLFDFKQKNERMEASILNLWIHRTILMCAYDLNTLLNFN